MISAPYRHLRDQLLSAPKVWVVTGVAGFIGSNLLQELLAVGQTVVGVGLEEAMDWYVERARVTAGRAVAATPRYLSGQGANPPHHAGSPLTLATP